MRGGRHQLLLDNSLEALSQMNLWFADLASREGIPERLGFAMELCLNEAVENIVRYAYDEVGPHQICVSLEIEPECLRAVIEDDGKPFNPLLAAAAFPDARTLEDFPIGGLGTSLIKAYAREATYARVGSKNRLQLVAGRAEPGSE
jgi:anti-sigma regulatory factor (Ser/Thr protein kinase)